MRRACFLLAVCCSNEREPPRPTTDLTREHDSAGTYAGVSFTTVFEQQANQTAPLVIMLHGRGDSARNFRDAWPPIPLKLELSFPLGSLPFNTGRQWFEWPPGTGDDAFADAVSGAEAKLWPAIVEIARGRKLVIGGFSQGAVMAYAIAIRHPDTVTAAVLIGGRIPRKLVPTGPTPPILALHGDADPVIPIDAMREGIASLTAAGVDATLVEYPGVGHTITPGMFERVIQLLRTQI